jgi:tRNA G37 N-methylase TrmD
MQLDTIKELFPSADVSVGRVFVLHEGQHVDIGVYVGDGMVMPSTEGQELLDSVTQKLVQHTIDTLAPSSKRVTKSTAKAIDLESVEL